ncbi:vacuolar protein sorting 13D [Cochliomyia hominivorax]
MLNELLTWVLNTYLGKYLEDFNPAQLSIALISGEVELENVPIRKDALRSFGIPVEAVSGSIGKIKLQIPVRQFRTSPWCIVIERLYGVFRPKDLNEWDSEKEKQNEYEYKLNILDAKEASWRIENDCNVESYYSLSYSSWLNYGATLATNILENLELKIIDVHLRYEDSVTTPNSPFSAGIRIGSISVQTCDNNWIPGVKNNDKDNVSYKLLELKDLCVYWDQLLDSNTCSKLSSKDLLTNMNDFCNIENHRFIINPINATAKFKRERCKQAIKNKNRPRLSCDVVLPQVIIVLNEAQYMDIVKCISFLQGIKRLKSFKVYRPTEDIKSNPKIWWKYASSCHGFIFRKSEEKWKIAKENIRYIKIYKRLLINPTEPLSKEDKQFKVEMEKLRRLNELKFLRDISYRKVTFKGLHVRSRDLNQSKGILYHWFPNWLGWYGNTSSTKDENYEKIEDDILDAIKETIENDTFSNRDAIFANFSFALSEGRISLNTSQLSKDTVVLEMEFDNLISFIEVKPKFSSYRVGISLGSVCLNDKLTDMSEFPYLIKPQTQENQKSFYSNFIEIFTKKDITDGNEPWFQLQYEKNPAEHQSDYRLTINSKSLDVVYNESTFKWLVNFFIKPINDLPVEMHLISKRKRYESRLKFFKNWKSVLMGQKDYRKKWSFEIDISAPRIICVENFKEKNSSVFVIDFGRFQLFKNERDSKSIALIKDNSVEMDSDDELFMTPCSTPPGSKVSPSESSAVITTMKSTALESSPFSKIVINEDTGLENALHSEIYDKYIINLTDLQVLVCKNREYGYACSKTSSTFHLLDKFNICIQLERRIINTSDPDYPSITLFGNLDKIVAHINEQKIAESLKILNKITLDLNNPSINTDINTNNVPYGEVLVVDNEIKEFSNTTILQFVVGQVILEVQSREKSIAEIQIIGAKAGINRKAGETNINMSVHGFLLVDAIQSFGHDFELLIASHRHVEMDSISGSLKQSEPCSPINPGSPDPHGPQRPTSPHTINKVINDLQLGSGYECDTDDALISIEINIINHLPGVEQMQIANITFNNLDIIANQETIVELLGFGKRIIDNYKLYQSNLETQKQMTTTERKKPTKTENVKTEINFDFHRLNILVLRSLRIENTNIGRKVGTLTMSEAKIHASMGVDLCVSGALGGIQIIDVTPEGLNHQRIFSVGKDPITDPPNLFKSDDIFTINAEIFGMDGDDDEFQYTNALSFKVSHSINSTVVIKIRMASVWYTHCPRFIEEIYLCVKEFRQYFKHFVKSLRNKASHMAKGLVHHISSSRLSNRSNKFGDISLDVILSTPVLVLPRSYKSTQVLVANLGKITICNTHENFENRLGNFARDIYFVDIRNVNLCSLNIDKRCDMRHKFIPKANEIYSCHKDAMTILYDTALLFQCIYETQLPTEEDGLDTCQTFLIDGSVTQNLSVCLSKSQYEQLKESLEYATNIMILKETTNNIGNETDVLQDVHVSNPKTMDFDKICVQFSVPIFKLDLKNEHTISLIHITLQEFCFYNKDTKEQREVQVLLRSVIVEDLKCPPNSKYRNIVDSSSEKENNNHASRNKISNSCPDLINFKKFTTVNKSLSIPANLNENTVTKLKNKSDDIKYFGKIDIEINNKSNTENLVIYKSCKSMYLDPEKPDEAKSSIDFNTLNLIISIEKWFMVFDFFGLVSNQENSELKPENKSHNGDDISRRELQIFVRSLNLILVRNESELSKANISNVILHIKKMDATESIDGRLGSISLYDLTQYGYLYQEKFSTSGSEALSFTYKRKRNAKKAKHGRTLDKDATLLIFMSSVKYVHTKRFIVEIHLFVKELLQLQSPVINRIKKTENTKDQNEGYINIGLEIHAESPIILLPVSFNSNHLLIADLGKFTLVNSFNYANDLNFIKQNDYNEIVDVMNIDLVNINVLTGERENNNPRNPSCKQNSNILHISDFSIVKLGDAIFKEKCHLILQVMRNTESNLSHNIPDIKVKGTLSELHGHCNLQQYKLIRGFLNYNLGETIDDVYYNYEVNVSESIEKLCSMTRVNETHNIQSTWNTVSMNFLLENVIISLSECLEHNSNISNSSLACIKFIKSTLEIDSFSDGSQDIDLISSEILIMDARGHFEGSNSKNVFKYILKPSVDGSFTNLVQAEIHSRKRNDSSKYTILLNNMRIMAILDYLEKLNNFIKEEPYMSSDISHDLKLHKTVNTQKDSVRISAGMDDNSKYEFVLNITNSEIVFVENDNQIDTNAIILKSTTVYSYKPNNVVVPMSIDINHLEIFSCILGSEGESSQSIIDPFTLNMELRNNCFQIQIQNKVFLRISYTDAMLFSRIMQSIPKQTNKHVLKHSTPRYDFEKIAPLVAMGFKHTECWHAIELNNFNINEAAIWLSQNKNKNLNTALEINCITLNANSISVCIIDDCLDADVPLLEVSFSQLIVKQTFQEEDEKSNKCFEGEINAVIASDYYNRRLSGWEPIIEPWQCTCRWKYSKYKIANTKSAFLHVNSKQVLKFNITSTLLELCDLVHRNWTEDYLKRSIYKNDDISSTSSNIRRRLPFVPFALKNLTGEPLIFKIFFSHAGGITRTEVTQQDLMCNWISAQPNETVPFDFGPQSKLRHLDSHKLNMHQILVQIHGWTLIGPISIDKVGTFFRYANQDMKYTKKTRIVFEISLMGSAQKLIVVRSAVNTINNTNKTFILRMKTKSEKESMLMTLKPLEKVTIPLRYVDSSIHLKPNSTVEDNETNNSCVEKSNPTIVTESQIDESGFCTRSIQWTNCVTNDGIQDTHSCYSPNKTPFHVLTEIRKDKYPVRDIAPMPGHTITIIPPLKLKNLLCCDLLFKIMGHTHGRLNASEEVEIYSIDINESFCLSITLDNYKLSGHLKIPMGHTGIVEPKLKLIDVLNRELFLRISIQSFPGKGMEIFIGAPIWIINKTGLPLIFRQEGTNLIASGQFDEHEYAREVSPLLFSFSDQEGSPLLEFRLGKSFGNNNHWCKSFGINKETTFRELKADQTKINYVIGVNVQRGTGLYNCTTFITLTPRFQLYNKSSYKLEFAQKCDIKKQKIISSDKVITALPGCNFPFHWPNCEQEPLLCVRVADDEYSYWSSGLPVYEAKSLYINIRNELGEMAFLRLEVILNGGTHLLHFTDANTLPPPIRIDNYSDVPIYFSQKGVEPHWRTNVKPQSSLAYVLDDPLGSQSLFIEAPGGNYIEYSIHKNEAKSITYANYIYIAFKETFQQVLTDCDSPNGIEGQQLVLGVKDKRVIITKKCAGDRSQLWLMNSYGQLEHEGSSPPTEFFKTHSTPRLVLDLEKTPNPNDYTKLVVRPQNNQRVTTQTWRFENGRLMCHANMCVQASNGVYGLQPGFYAVLGRMEPCSRASTSNNIPFEQSIEIQKLRPGSGHLEVINKMDGPIKSIQIRDVKINSDEIVLTPDPLWNHASVFNKGIIDETNLPILNELMIELKLLKGLGISVVSRSPCEELSYITLEDIVVNIILLPFSKSIEFKVRELQIDNQLLETQCPIILYSWKTDTENTNREAMVLRAKLLPSPNINAVIFEYFLFDIKPCTVIIEERFILKTALFLGYQKDLNRQSKVADNQIYRTYEYPFSKNTKRFYFENCIIGSTQVRLSVLTASKLNPELIEIKKSLGLTLIKFEDAIIEFDKFSDRHHFETLDVYVKALKSHYINQLKWHAASILGSVDFLGNPLGFANDLSEGVSGLIFEGSVKSLVKNVTHGISNSTAKLTETLSDSLGRVVLDEHDNETRQKILEVAYPTSGGHLAAGLKGFGFGLLGGVTSIVRHTYVGAQTDGLPGFLSGLGKGIVGTVTKPLIGVLDLAAETASAVRETSRGSHHFLPDRKRLPRCVTGAPGGLLPFYSYRQSKGQQYLYIINHRNFGEKLIFYEPNLCNDKEAQLRLLVSTEYIRIFSRCDEDPAIMFECHLSEVLSCHALTTNTTTSNKVIPNYYIEISTNVPKVTRPRVRCQSEEIAERASRCINYAKAVFDERELSVANF